MHATKNARFAVRLRTAAFVVTSALLVPLAGAQTSVGTVVVQAESRVGGVTTGLPGCALTTASGGGLQQLTQSCGVPNGATATANNRAYAQAPITFNPNAPGSYQLAGRGARSRLGVEVLSFNGTGRDVNQAPIGVTASSFASYRDFLLLGAVRPATLRLDFQLSGELRIGAALGSLNSYQTDAFYTVGVQSIYVASDGALVAADPLAVGGVNVRRQLKVAGATPTVNVDVQSDPALAFTHSERPNSLLGVTDISVTLGAPFFSNPDNRLLLLDLSLASSAFGPAFTFTNLPFGTVLTDNEISADFGSTFEMVGLQAFDDVGQDITASAVLGLQSVQAIPEPTTALLWLIGLAAWVGWSRQKKSHHTNF